MPFIVRSLDGVVVRYDDAGKLLSFGTLDAHWWARGAQQRTALAARQAVEAKLRKLEDACQRFLSGMDPACDIRAGSAIAEIAELLGATRRG